MSTSLPPGLDAKLHDLAKKLREVYGEAEVYLYGSFAKGTWLEDSDVDIVVISPSFRDQPFSDRVNEVRKLASPDIALEILAYTPDELERVKRRSIVIQDAAEYWRKIEVRL